MDLGATSLFFFFFSFFLLVRNKTDVLSKQRCLIKIIIYTLYYITAIKIENYVYKSLDNEYSLNRNCTETFS